MKLSEVHDENKEVSAKPISGFKNAIAIQILKNGLLKEHISKTPATLVCVLGEALYEDEKDHKVTLKPGDIFEIEPLVKHKVKGIADSQLILIK